MDDNEKKNIDGIKPAASQEKTENAVNNIEITTDDESITTEDQSVTIDTNGEMANTDVVVQEEVVSEESDTKSEDTTSSDEPESPITETPVDTTPINSVTPAVVQSAIDEKPQSTSNSDAEVTKLKERNKHLRIWLAILVVLLVGLASALVVYFAQQSKAQSDLDAANQENAALQQQIAEQESNATQAKVTELQTELDAEKAKNAELTAENQELSETIAAYEVATTKLLELCGEKCTSVTVPDSTTPAEETPPTN